MTAWEYKMVTVSALKSDAAFINELNISGEVGWELVAVLSLFGTDVPRAIMKRARDVKADPPRAPENPNAKLFR